MSTPELSRAQQISLQLQRNPHGRLVLTLPDGTVHADVVPVRAFPIAAPDEGLSLIGSDGNELLWLERSVARGAPGLLTRARRVQREWPRGLLAGTYPPAAWWTLARVMEGGGDHEGAVRCHERARRWLQTARLPGAGAGIREGFLNGNPINRLVLGPLDSP